MNKSSNDKRITNKANRKRTITQRAWDEFLSHISLDEREALADALSTDHLDNVALDLSYLKYDNIVILQTKSLQRAPLSTILQSLSVRNLAPRLWASLARAFQVSHVGATAPIPLHLDDGSEAEREDVGVNGTNVLRSPTSFQPLHGNFGNASAPFSATTGNETFWAAARQHGVTQVWAPLHTMFSNGNVSEKARVKSFERLQPSTAVDLYAGVGYFALFYRKHVADLVLGWEINPWSVEGFRRGAEANGRGKETVVIRGTGALSGKEQLTILAADDRLRDEQSTHLTGTIIFEDSNELAADQVDALSRLKSIPPIRHINCGYLPSSSPSWKTAVQLLLSESGTCAEDDKAPVGAFGWVHAHENIATKDIEARTVEVVALFQALSDQRVAEIRGAHCSVQVSCGHVARVKTYAPGVYHCVLDIFIECRPQSPR